MLEPLFTKKQIAFLIIPLIIDQLLSTLIGFVDTIMVSGVGESAISGVSLVDSLNRLFIFVFAAIATGGTIVASQYLGRRDLENARNAGKQIYMVTLAISVTVTLICVIGRKPILSFIYGSVEPAVMQNALIYFMITAFAYPALAQINTSSAVFRAAGNSKFPMLVSLIMTVIHIGFNAYFILVLKLGAEGAAFGTLIARYVAAAILFCKLQMPSTVLNLRGMTKYRPNWEMIRRILRVGLPTGFESSMFETGKLIVLSVIATFGTASIAANAVANSLNGITYAAGMAVAMSMMPVVGQCIGAGRQDEASRYMKHMTLLGIGMMAGLNLLIILFKTQLLAIYGFTDNAAEIAGKLILICCIGTMTVWGPAFILPYGLRATGDVRYPMAVSIASMWTVRLGIGYLLSVGFGIGVEGIWFAQVGDWLVRTTFYCLRYYSGKWRKHQVLR